MGNAAKTSVKLAYGIKNLGIGSIKVVRKARTKTYNVRVKSSNQVIAVIENGVIRVIPQLVSNDISNGKTAFFKFIIIPCYNLIIIPARYDMGRGAQ